MRTIWEYSPRTEGLRLLHNSHQIATGFFRANGFLVLPLGHQATGDHVVYTPDLPYLSVPRFWAKSSRIDASTLPLQAPSDLVHSVTKLLASSPIPAPNYAVTESLWTAHQDQIISMIYQLIPGKKDAIKNITIYPTVISTGCSFNAPSTFPAPIYLWLRADKGVASIVEALLSALTRRDVYTKLDGLWQESEIIVDWLLTFSPLADILKRVDPIGLEPTLTIKSTRSKQHASLTQESQSFLQKIGAPVVSPHSFTSLPQNGFSPREKEVLDLLVSRSPRVVSMDDIGDLLFKDNPDSYSLAAIAKTIQRLRDKLEANGISGSFIQTKRGEGYLLVN